jgi:intracellular septation protein A
MNMSFLFFSFLPILAYLVCDAIWGLNIGIIAAMVASFIFLGYEYYVFGELSEIAILEVGLITTCGFVSLALKNRKYFKIQPAIIQLILMLVLLWYQIFDQPLLLKMIPKLIKISPELGHLLQDPETLIMLQKLSIAFILLLFFHSLLIVWSAIRFNNLGWFLSRLSIYPLSLFLVILVRIF